MQFYLLRTISNLRLRQVFYQLKNRLIKVKYQDMKYFDSIALSLKLETVILKSQSLVDNNFCFLNLCSPFFSWNYIDDGMLWAYNLNYMDWLLQENMTFIKGSEWIDRFIKDLPQNRIGLDPYPIALRGINWIKFISLHYEEVNKLQLKRWNDSLYSQYKLLEKKLEYHLLGNHLLEDAYSLFIAAIYFKDFIMYEKASKLLLEELKEQVLPDGAHYEQSPMYHCILLDRLLDYYNFSYNNQRFTRQKQDLSLLRDYCIRMLGHLNSIIYEDKSYPLFNDSALGIAPEPTQLFSYAERLGLQWRPFALKESGYRKMSNQKMEAFVDVGNITASYQPGHSHADTFNYELRIKGVPFVVDTGISTYNKTERRQFERGTLAHNTVSVEDKNSSEVWGGFRVGKRAKVKILVDEENYVKAFHDGFGTLGIHTRSFRLTDEKFDIKDWISTSKMAKSIIHLDSRVHIGSYNEKQIITDVAVINIEGADRVEVIEGKISTEYNVFERCSVIVISFRQELHYCIEYR